MVLLRCFHSNVTADLYKGTTVSVWCKDEVTDGFETMMGLRHGFILSSLQFSLFMNNLSELSEEGCNFKGVKTKTLLITRRY